MYRKLRKTMLFLLSFCMLIGLFTCVAGAAPTAGTPLFDAGSGTALSILLPASPTDSEADASQTLQTYLEEITGAKPEIVNAAADADGGVIALAVSAELAAEPKGSYVLRCGQDARQQPTDDPVFYIDAADARGLYNGVYGFLRRVCGVEIYATNVKRVPQAERIAPETPYWYAYTPTLEYEDTDWISPHDTEFALANGLNGIYSPLEHIHGGKVNYLWFCHSITNTLVAEDRFFEDHPEYYALQEDGTREATQLCLSNPDVIA